MYSYKILQTFFFLRKHYLMLSLYAGIVGTLGFSSISIKVSVILLCLPSTSRLCGSEGLGGGQCLCCVAPGVLSQVHLHTHLFPITFFSFSTTKVLAIPHPETPRSCQLQGEKR